MEQLLFGNRISAPDAREKILRYKNYQRASRFITDYNCKMSAMASRQSPFCKKGCCHCCYQNFFVSQTEIDAIVLYLLNNEESLDTFLSNNEKREEMLAGNKDLVTRCEQPTDEGSQAAIEFNKLRIPCAFLHEGICLVYPVRPIVCAAFVSIAPARICATEFKCYLSGEMNTLLTTTKRVLEAGSPGKIFDVSRACVQALQNICAPPLGADAPTTGHLHQAA